MRGIGLSPRIDNIEAIAPTDQQHRSQLAKETYKQLEEIDCAGIQFTASIPVDRLDRQAITLGAKPEIKTQFTISYTQHPNGAHVIRLGNNSSQRAPIWFQDLNELNSLPSDDKNFELYRRRAFSEISVVVTSKKIQVKGLSFDDEMEEITMKYPALSTLVNQLVALTRTKVYQKTYTSIAI